jgi:hypothetical protein
MEISSIISSRSARLCVLISLILSGGCEASTDTGGGSDSGASGVACAEDSGCGDGQVCVNGECADTDTEFNCASAGCPDNYTCMPTGLCQGDVECVSDGDCCPTDSGCLFQCVDFHCVGDQCAVGDVTECYDGCHRGERVCDNGIWRECNADPVTEVEICDDGVDNDCDGTTDLPCPDCTPGYVRPCDTPCGPGFQTCSEDSDWSDCDAPISCLCDPGDIATQPCGNCGFVENICMEQGVWSTSEICLSQGVCPRDEIETQACGSCGTQSRSCDDTCGWSEWGTCESGGTCTPGDEEQQSCGSCGAQTRTCDDSCGWTGWSDCEEGSGCQQGDTQEQSCGFCGVKTKSCLEACGAWPDAWGPCLGEGICEPGEVETEGCGNCGTRERTCSASCGWSSWSGCGDQGLCEPGDEEEQSCGPSSSQGICEPGVQYRSCGSGCQWNAWNACAGATFPSSEVCANGVDEDCDGEDLAYPDQYESNDSCATCTLLNSNVEEDMDLEDHILFGGFHDPSDTDDYYCFYGKDNSQGLFWTAEKVEVSLTSQPLGVDGDLYIYKGQANCVTGFPDAYAPVIGAGDEEIMWEETSGEDDDLFIIRVQNWGEPNCYGDYELRINGLK